MNTGDEGAVNISASNSLLTSLLGTSGLLSFANGRVYAVKYNGTLSGNPFLPGWPVKIGIIDAGLLPDVGEGINGSPVVARLACPSGGSGMKIGLTPDAGPAYILNSNGTSCYGAVGGRDVTLGTDVPPGAGRYDTPAYAAVGYPAFGSLDGKQIDFFAPATGLFRALDLAAPEYQGGQDFLGGWNAADGQFVAGYPSPVNDLQFLTGPVVGNVLGGSGQQVIGGTSSLDLEAFDAHGAVASSAWPKLTGDWTAATPTLGSFGTLDTSRTAHKDVVSLTRSGTLAVYQTPASACSPSSSPRFHHDIANSGDYTRDAVPPGRPMNGRVVVRTFRGRVMARTLRFRAPGNDLLCGTARSYQMVTSAHPITPQSFSRATRLRVALAPAAAGTPQRLTLPHGTLRYVAIRAVDPAGNLGRPLVLRVSSVR